jgi:hypothetical protein
MHAYVVIATKGRAQETWVLMNYLQRQTLKPTFTIIVGAEKKDLERIDQHPLINSGQAIAVVSPKVGLPAQRNFGLETLEKKGYFQSPYGSFFCIFFDDDYRTDNYWLEHAAERFKRSDIVGLTGQVLADGVRFTGLSEKQAEDYLADKIPHEQHWAGGKDEREIGSVYGCNMAFIDKVVKKIRFDENLPLYAWQEDLDYTGMAKTLGKVIYFPDCKGVHLGVKNGRVSGLKFGYSQIANPLYLIKKGTVSYPTGLRLVFKALAVNIVRGMYRHHPFADYRGRLRGNMKAIIDMLYLKLDPRNIERI